MHIWLKIGDVCQGTLIIICTSTFHGSGASALLETLIEL